MGIIRSFVIVVKRCNSDYFRNYINRKPQPDPNNYSGDPFNSSGLFWMEKKKNCCFVKRKNMLKENEETGCCKRFDPTPWQEKEIQITDRLFVKDQVRSFLHIPLNFGKVMKRNMEKIEKAGAKSIEPVILSDEHSPWGSNVYIAVEKNVPDSEMVKLSGKYLTKVFEGNYKDMGKWISEMKNYMATKDKVMKKLYFFYTTCPACAKAYGKNYTVLLGEI